MTTVNAESETLYDLFRQGREDEVLLALNEIESKKFLTPSELVLRGQCIQLGSGAVVADYKEAGKAFRAALAIDKNFVPALLELGWFLYAPEDKAFEAISYFDRAIKITTAQLREAIQGRADCLEEVDSEEAAEGFRKKMAGALFTRSDFVRELADAD